MPFTMTVPAGEAPKRGDLLQTNHGDRRERTWFILRVRKIARRTDAPLGTVKPRFDVWRARWWELESDFRIRLYRSAERRGGQVVWFPEPKTGFENLRRPKATILLLIFLLLVPTSIQAKPHPKLKAALKVAGHLAIGAGTEIAVSRIAGGPQKWPAGLVAAGAVAGFKEGSDALSGADTSGQKETDFLTLKSTPRKCPLS
jgi:hypothetical protein